MRAVTLTLLLVLALAPPGLAQDSKLSETELDAFYYQVDQLGSTRWAARERATKALVAMGGKIGPYIVEELAEVEEEEVAVRLRKVLVAIGMAHLDEQAMEATLKDVLEPLDRAGLVYWSPRHQDAPSPRGTNGRKALEAITKQLAPRQHPALARAYASAAGPLRTNLAYLMGTLKVKSAADALTAALTADKEPQARQLAASALAKLGAVRAVPALAQCAARDEQPDVRLAAICALGAMRERAAVEALIGLLPAGDADPAALALASHVKHWLRRLTGHRTRYNPYDAERRAAGVLAWRTWWKANGKTFEFVADATPRRSLTMGRSSTSSRVDGRVLEVVGGRKAVIKFKAAKVVEKAKGAAEKAKVAAEKAAKAKAEKAKKAKAAPAPPQDH